MSGGWIILFILAAFFCGAVYGYGAGIMHCEKEHHDNDKPFGYKG